MGRLADLLGTRRGVRQRARRLVRDQGRSFQAAKAPARSESHTNRGASRGDYTVRPGDTLSEVAARHGTTWQKVYAANKAVIGADPHLIVPGQRLDI